MKSKRQAQILELIREQDIETQNQMMDALALRGIKSTQATLSRDIKELRLVKKLSSSGVATSRVSTTARGIYPYSCTVSTTDGVTSAAFVMYSCYNSTQTGTINGTYTARVYGVKLYDLIGG